MGFLLVSIPSKMASVDLHQRSASPINLKVANRTFWESVQSKAFNNFSICKNHFLAYVGFGFPSKEGGFCFIKFSKKQPTLAFTLFVPLLVAWVNLSNSRAVASSKGSVRVTLGRSLSLTFWVTSALVSTLALVDLHKLTIDSLLLELATLFFLGGMIPS